MQNGVADFNYFLQRKLIDSLTKPFLFITCELFLNIPCTPDNFQKTLKTIKNIEISKYFCVYYLDQLAIPPPHRFILTITSTKQWMPIFIHFFFFSFNFNCKWFSLRHEPFSVSGDCIFYSDCLLYVLTGKKYFTYSRTKTFNVLNYYRYKMFILTLSGLFF